MSGESDDTIRLRRPHRGERRILPFALGLIVAASLGAAGTWWGLRPTASVAPAPVQTASLSLPAPAGILPPAPPPPAPAAPPPPYEPPLATETEILTDAPETLAVYRFMLQPSVVVLQFPDLVQQGRMLNRVAALVEKAGFPHDRVTPESELNERIRAAGMTPDTFYYGHDYDARSVLRFLALAGDELNDDEKRLQLLVDKLGWREGNDASALISLVRESPDANLDELARATVLRHELSHGFYFTDAAYAEFVHRFWTDIMTAHDRERFTEFLSRDGYDPALSDLIINETQAYLMFTPDRRFFSPSAVGLPETRLAELRRQFLAGMPPSWLHNLYIVPPVSASPITPVRAPRRNQGRLLVRTRRTLVDRRAPRRAAASRAARSSRT